MQLVQATKCTTWRDSNGTFGAKVSTELCFGKRPVVFEIVREAASAHDAAEAGFAGLAKRLRDIAGGLAVAADDVERGLSPVAYGGDDPGNERDERGQ